MKYRRMAIEKESPEEYGYGRIECNLSESSVTDAVLSDLKIALQDLTLYYGEHRGEKRLREVIAAQYDGIRADDVLVTAGAAAALFIVNTSLLEKGDHIIVEHPNYGTNIETPRVLECHVDLARLKFENEFQPDIELVRQKISGDTKLVSFTNPHNPSGTVLGYKGLVALIDVVEKAASYLLVDETYRDLMFRDRLPVAAALSERVISVSSISKAYGLPGIRIGWIICRSRELMDLFLAAKEQIYICNSVVDESIAHRFLEKRRQYLTEIQKRVEHNFDILKSWMSSQRWLEWVEPRAGVVCFPRFRSDAGVDTSLFYRILLEDFGTYVAPGHWFDMDDRYMRLGYAWPDERTLKKGLENIERAAKAAVGRPTSEGSPGDGTEPGSTSTGEASRPQT